MKIWNLAPVAVLFAFGCGGGTSSSPGGGGGVPGININVISPAGPAAVDSGLTLPIKVEVTSDSHNAGVIWTVAAQRKGDPAGSLSDIQPTAVTYNPPPNLSSPIQVTVLGTSVTDPSRSAPIPISVYPALRVQPAPGLPGLATAFLNVDYSCIKAPFEQGVLQVPCELAATGGLGPYTWTIVGNTSLPDGLFLGRGSVPANTSIVGTPTLTGIFPLQIQVTDSLGASVTAPFSINVAPSRLKVVTPTILSYKKGVPYPPIQLQVSGGIPPYMWMIAPGSPSLPGDTNPGDLTLTPSGVIGGTPTSGLTTSIAVRVIDSQSPVPAEATFPTPTTDDPRPRMAFAATIEQPCNPIGAGVLAGTPYAFVLTGFDGNGPVTLAGSFTPNSDRSISTGIEDTIRAGTGGVQLAQPLVAGGFIGFDTGNQFRGCMALNTASGSGNNTTQFSVWHTSTTVDPSSNQPVYFDGRMMEFDDTTGSGTRAVGFFRKQDVSAQFEGKYAFRFSGWDGSGSRFSMIGVMTADSSQRTLSSITADLNVAGLVSGPLSGGSGTFTAADAQGRGSATLSVGTGAYDLIYYLIDSEHVVFVSSNAPSPAHPSITGEATLAARGPFSESSLSNSHIYRLAGSVNGSSDLNIGVTHFDAQGSVSGVSFTRSGGSASSTVLSGQYAVDPGTGRFSFSGTAIPAVGYLVEDPSGLTAYLLGTGSSAAYGEMEFQTDQYPPGYPVSPLKPRTGLPVYGFGTDEMLHPEQAIFVGTIDPNSAANVGLIDGSTSFGLLPFETYIMFAYQWNADGSGTFGGNTFMVTNEKRFFYIDSSPLDGHPDVIVGKQQDSAP